MRKTVFAAALLASAHACPAKAETVVCHHFLDLMSAQRQGRTAG